MPVHLELVKCERLRNEMMTALGRSAEALLAHRNTTLYAVPQETAARVMGSAFCILSLLDEALASFCLCKDRMGRLPLSVTHRLQNRLQTIAVQH